MENFTPVSSLLGGLLIGLSSIALLLLSGRIAGISSILENGLFAWKDVSNRVWSLWFLVGLFLGGEILRNFLPDSFGGVHQHKMWMIVLGGLLVGFGSRLGSGCTSGHGVCGLGRLSSRSLVSVLIFMSSAGLTVWLIRTFFL
ncbi:MAG: YeeE/YedE thiosulfate transporter family protein [Leptospiraceae bacterium]|nr:YeeE/YedE thiosulfate transporter family protein [Leptospiraceae bacterium]